MAIIGPNGGGKTTLLKLILGLLKPDKGKIRVLGERPGRQTHALGYVPQNVLINEHFPITALDVALMGGLGAARSTIKSGQSKKESERQAMTTLERMGMAAYARRKIGELSGGQRQRVFIARALMSHPRLLLLDEPTASIDTKGQAEFLKMLETLNSDVAILVVTHDLFSVARYVKSVACVNHGLHFHCNEKFGDKSLESVYHPPLEDVCQVQLLAKGMGRPHEHRRSPWKFLNTNSCEMPWLQGFFLTSIICGIMGTLVVVNRIVFLSGGIAHAAYGGIGMAFYFNWPILPSTMGFFPGGLPGHGGCHPAQPTQGRYGHRRDLGRGHGFWYHSGGPDSGV